MFKLAEWLPAVPGIIGIACPKIQALSSADNALINVTYQDIFCASALNTKPLKGVSSSDKKCFFFPL